MGTLRGEFEINSSSVRGALNIAPATLHDILRKQSIPYADHDLNKSRGHAKKISGPNVRRVFESRGYSYPSPAKIISFMMCKGGVGKSTSTSFLSQRMASYGSKILVIDGDPQGNLTASFNLDLYKFEVDEETPVLTDILTKTCSLEEAIIAITPSFHLIPSSPLNANLDGKIRELFKNPSLAIKKFIEPVLSNYNYILIDCAPALNLTNTAIISASDLVILPVTPDKFSQIGLEQTIREIQQIENDFSLQIEKKLVFTRFDAREYTSLRYLSEIAENHRERMFKTMIRTASDLKNAITKKEDLFSYKKSNAKEDYDNLAKEIMGLDLFFEKRVKI